MSHNGAARIRQEALRIPTYPIREDPNPPLFSGADPWVYPYPKQDEFIRPKDEGQTYQAIVMENPYLQVTVLPELGGRVYAAYDKTVGRELYHKPGVIKPALIGLRGAWICGGIEFNFIKGHHVLTVSKVDHLIRQNPDGSVSTIVGHMERRSRARWTVTLTLHPERAYLQVDLRLYNRYRYPLDFYQWSNSAVVARDDLRFPYPMDYAISSGRTLYRFPTHGGADISRWTGIPIAHDLFSIGSDRPFFGVYYDDLDVGMVHYANYYEAPGKKLFTWGTDDAGRIWDDLLTDANTPYIEPQAGAVLDQQTFVLLQPHQVVEWREYWWGVHGIKSFVEVNNEAALNLAPAGPDKTFLAVNTTRRLAGARLRLLVNGQVKHEVAFDISPDEPFTQEIDLPPAAWREADTQLVLTDAQDRELIRYHKPQPNMFVDVELPRPFKPQVDVHSSADELVIAGREAEKLREYERAEALYRQALAVDPGMTQAHAALGALYSRQGLYLQARGELEAALRRDPDCWVAHYQLGLVCRELGDDQAARTHFWATRLDPGHDAQSFYYLGEMALAQGQPDEARAFFRRSLDRNALHVKAHDMLAVALRKLGRPDEARAVLQNVLDQRDPTDILAQAELWQLDRSPERAELLLARLGDEVQLLLELGSDYVGAGLWQEAIDTLGLWPGVAEEQPAQAMIYYHLGYAQDKLGQIDASQRCYGLAAQMDPAYVFPHRLEELDILARALALNPGDARALAYRGTLLYALRRKEEARAAWRAALAIQPDAVTHRNLGKSLWQDLHDLAGARHEYERAITLNAEDYHLFADLADLLAEIGVPAEERIALLRCAPQHGRVQARLAAAHVAQQDWDEAIQILTTMQYDPYEGERDTRPAYYEAFVGRGLARYQQGNLRGALSDFAAALEYPHNVGVGKSYFSQDTKALYWAGVAAEGLGERDQARAYWEEGASIRARPEEVYGTSTDGYSPEARHFKSLCLQRLGRSDEAAKLF